MRCSVSDTVKTISADFIKSTSLRDARIRLRRGKGPPHDLRLKHVANGINRFGIVNDRGTGIIPLDAVDDVRIVRPADNGRVVQAGPLLKLCRNVLDTVQNLNSQLLQFTRGGLDPNAIVQRQEGHAIVALREAIEDRPGTREAAPGTGYRNAIVDHQDAAAAAAVASHRDILRSRRHLPLQFVPPLGYELLAVLLLEGNGVVAAAAAELHVDHDGLGLVQNLVSGLQYGKREVCVFVVCRRIAIVEAAHGVEDILAHQEACRGAEIDLAEVAVFRFIRVRPTAVAPG